VKLAGGDDDDAFGGILADIDGHLPLVEVDQGHEGVVKEVAGCPEKEIWPILHIHQRPSKPSYLHR
jgi:hypothetical protein